jgi:hypothetical protein
LVYVQQPQALPMTILGIYPRLETESVWCSYCSFWK